MQHGSLGQGCPDRPMQAVLKVERVLPLDDVSEEIPVERGVLGQQLSEIEGPLGRHQFIQSDLTGWHIGPLPRSGVPVIRVWPSVADRLENHPPIV